MIPEAPALVALHLGAATTATAMIGQVEGRWRLLGTLAGPAGTDPEALVATLAERLGLADPALAGALGLDGVDDWPRLVSRGGAAPRLAVLAVSERTLERLELAGRRAGWAVLGRSAQRADPLEMTRALLDGDVGTVLVGASDPPAADERSLIGDLAELVAAAARRRPELTVVLAGAMADLSDRFTGTDQSLEPVAASVSAVTVASSGRGLPGRPADATSLSAGSPAESGEPLERTEPLAPEAAEPALSERGPLDAEGSAPVILVEPARAGRAAGAGSLIIAPAPSSGTPQDEPLRRLLDDLRAGPDDVWRGIVRSTETLAGVLDRRIETVALGQSAGLRAVAQPRGAGEAPIVAWATVPEAALVPDLDEALVDRVIRWSTTTIDRHRLRDRLAEMSLAPWGGCHGDGAPLRLAAARAALERLVALTPELSRPVPDVILATGGVWAAAPGPAVALALADVVRRPGASQLALDHARILGPVGTIEDVALRSRMIADLADDLLAPLGCLVLPAGLRAGRSAGRLVVDADAGTTELDLVPGGLELVDLPPGEAAVAEFRFVDTVVLGTRGRRFALDVGGGLGGLLVDLRDVPLRLPDRPDRRRELLGAWQRALWVGLEA